ncbi:MAG: LysM peptidoglycan-binding domain-containing protein [Deltaproteobacteria bacterium]|nr:LysM peptidoglycan-binding domain-containing protein [Deltaproteobacteria bacterium]
MLALALSLILSPGCSPVSDEEMERLRGETEALAAELTRLRNESELLDRALTNVYREKDRVVDRLNALSGDGPVPEEAPAGGLEVGAGGEAPAAGEGAGAAAGGRRIYVAQRGDSLSMIAKRNNTTLQAILDLNPYLANRPGYMVWEKDPVTLPN